MANASVSVVVTVGEHQYSFWGQINASLDPAILAASQAAYLPATILKADNDSLSDSDVERLTSKFGHDDVWNVGFLQGAYRFVPEA